MSVLSSTDGEGKNVIHIVVIHSKACSHIAMFVSGLKWVKVTIQHPISIVWAHNYMIDLCGWARRARQSASHCQAHSEELKCNEWAGLFLFSALIEQ